MRSVAGTAPRNIAPLYVLEILLALCFQRRHLGIDSSNRASSKDRGE